MWETEESGVDVDMRGVGGLRRTLEKIANAPPSKFMKHLLAGSGTPAGQLQPHLDAEVRGNSPDISLSISAGPRAFQRLGPAWTWANTVAITGRTWVPSTSSRARNPIAAQSRSRSSSVSRRRRAIRCR